MPKWIKPRTNPHAYTEGRWGPLGMRNRHNQDNYPHKIPTKDNLLDHLTKDPPPTPPAKDNPQITKISP